MFDQIELIGRCLPGSGPAGPLCGLVCASGRCGVVLRGHPVEADRVGVAQHQVEHPPVAHVKPVVGQLLLADLILHQPFPVQARAGTLGPGRRIPGARAGLMPLNVIGFADDRLAARVPAGINRRIATFSLGTGA